MFKYEGEDDDDSDERQSVTNTRLFDQEASDPASEFGDQLRHSPIYFITGAEWDDMQD
jgi:hypothetical protein